jgi:hypothetical protein
VPKELFPKTDGGYQEVHLKPRLNAITLAVDSLEKSLAFYREGTHKPDMSVWTGSVFE